MRGRKPKPTSYKIATGNPGKRKLNDAEPTFSNDVPRCPPWMDAEAKREWNRISSELSKAGLLGSAYAGPLAVYVQAFSDFRAASLLIKKHGLTTETDKGNVIQHPAVSIRNKAMSLLLKAAA